MIFGPANKSTTELSCSILKRWFGQDCSISRAKSFIVIRVFPLSRIFIISSLRNLKSAGEIVGGTGATVDPWKLSTDEALSLLRELYVTNYDDWYKWGWGVWFALTPDGERAAAPLKGDTS